ncbi:hypothetical protein [Actinomadura soli]|uniref:hypothetical protein n=1 Tax=Actinomadura soli TaxID=2508997 RepID=UPI001486DDC0|nr:hypothetical protein [Actinomadura soli]
MESSGRGQARRGAGPETRAVMVWPEAPTMGAQPRLGRFRSSWPVRDGWDQTDAYP